MRKGKFVLDCFPDDVFEGFTDDDTWNGFACPYFTHQEAMRLLAVSIAYAKANDLTEDEIETDWKPEDWAEAQVDGITVYGVGAYGWTWWEKARRYTIELRVVEVTEDGDTLPDEIAGATLDYATTDLEYLQNKLGDFLDDIDSAVIEWASDSSERRPVDEEEWA